MEPNNREADLTLFLREEIRQCLNETHIIDRGTNLLSEAIYQNSPNVRAD